MWLNRPKSQLTATIVRIPDSETYVFTFVSSYTNITFHNLHFYDKSTFIIYHVTFIVLSKKLSMNKKHFINTNFEWNTPIDQNSSIATFFWILFQNFLWEISCPSLVWKYTFPICGSSSIFVIKNGNIRVWKVVLC